MMNKAQKLKIFTAMRDYCSIEPEYETFGNETFSKREESAKIYEGLEATGDMDYNYLANLKGRSGYELARHPENLTFQECCSVLTFLLRAEHWTEYPLDVEAAYKVLSRACDLLS